MIKISEIMFYGRYFDNGKQKYNNYWRYSKADPQDAASGFREG